MLCKYFPVSNELRKKNHCKQKSFKKKIQKKKKKS